MTETMFIIPGRSQAQGTSLNGGKLEPEYMEVTSTVEMNGTDMKRMGLADGDEVRISNANGAVVVRCKGRDPQDLPAGLMFMPYGPCSSRLMASDTGASGMPISKNIEVDVEAVRQTGEVATDG